MYNHETVYIEHRKCGSIYEAGLSTNYPLDNEIKAFLNKSPTCQNFNYSSGNYGNKIS